MPSYPDLCALLIAATKLQEELNLGLVNLLSSPMAAVLVSVGLLELTTVCKNCNKRLKNNKNIIF